MKTIYTTLPIYNSIAKQAYERSKKVAKDGTFAITCPITEIPSFQWLDYGDGCVSVSKIETVDFNGVVTDITANLPALPTTHAITGDVYFVYSGGDLSTPLSCGLYYLKITMDLVESSYVAMIFYQYNFQFQ